MSRPMPVTQTEETWVQQVVQESWSQYQRVVRTIQLLRELRSMRLAGRVPRAFEEILGKGVRSPMSWSLVQLVTAIIGKANPKFYRVARRPSEKDGAARVAAAAWPLIETYSRLAKKDLYYLSIDQLVGDGRSVWKLYRRSYPEYPVRQPGEPDEEYSRRVKQYELSFRGEPPIRARLVDPATFFPSREEGEPSFVVESGDRPTLTTLRALQVAPSVGGRLVPLPIGQPFPLETMSLLPPGSTGRIRVDEVWTRDYCYVRLLGQTLKFENEFGVIPYAWRMGQPSSINDVILEGTSVIFPFISVEPWLNTMISTVVAWAILGGTPMLAVETDPQVARVSDTQETAPSDIPLGRMLFLAPGRRVSFVQPPTVGQELIQAVEMIMGMYDRAGLGPIVRGQVGTRTPGLTFSAAMEAATDLIRPIVHNAEGLLEDVVSLTMRLCDNLNMALWVTGTNLVPREPESRKVQSLYLLDPKDIDGYYDIHCEINLTNVQDMVGRGMHANNMRQAGLWSEERAMRFAGVENPDSERVEILKDHLRQNPLYQQLILRRVLEDEPELQQALQQMEQAQQAMMQPPGAPPPGGPPGPPPAPPVPGAPEMNLPPGVAIANIGGGRPAGMPRRPTGPGPIGTRLGEQGP